MSLLKGGGAIRGIGEKFTANSLTGTGSMSVPIPVTPGRGGFGPQLTLSYDSGVGNGPFGFGWSLGLPAVTRKTDKGLPRYRDAEDSDVFVLSGAEDLVPVLRADPDGGWATDGLGREIIDDQERDGHTVRRYRPRVEGLFARIERWTRLSDGDVHWRSISRENVTTHYGSTEDSRVADPADPSRVFSWLISESFDDKGNAVVYQYRPEDSAEVDTAQAHERNRSARTRSAQRYPKRIRYGNRVSRFVQPDLAQAEWLFEVVFDYGEHHADTPTPDDPGVWPCRHDPFSTYRSGFEVRSYRLCRRVLMFHHVPEPGVGKNCVARSLDLGYQDDDGTSRASFLTSVTQWGWKRSDGGYLRRSLPPVEFEYSQAVVQDTVQELDPDSMRNLPAGLAAGYRWVDLDGQGLPGILTEQDKAWYYKPNLGGGRFGPLATVTKVPSWAALADGRQQLLDLAGTGSLDLVEFGGATPGYAERVEDGGWSAFTPFRSLPGIDWDDPDLRFVDLDGDGHADVLITAQDVFTWHRSLATDGFGPAQRVAQPRDEEDGPRLVFADGTQSIHLADMSGDGLADLVRVRNGEVCYWANLGHGRFGAKVTMDGAPWHDHPDQFGHERVRLADVDGSGTTDLIHLGRDAVRLYFNESGNRWSEPWRMPQLPHLDNHTSVTTADLLGNGTTCLVWSSPAPADARGPLRYIDLMGGRKPHLLVRTVNNLGAETRVHYVSSTVFSLADQAAGRPWITRLPFPVHVVDRVETYDHVSRSRFVTRYAYHHGHFDGVEREFRGFGLVESFDTETFTALGTSPADNLDAASHVPPVLTRTWYHTGVYLGRDGVSTFHAGSAGGTGEYYREPTWLDDPQEAARHLLDDTVLPDGLTPEEEREACRALKGTMLRQEVYALDGTGTEDHPYGHPYTVTEQNATVTVQQPRGPNLHAVCFTHPRETLTHHYERNPADPRTTHELTLEVDRFGTALKTASIGYPRRTPDPALAEADQPRQTRTWVGYTEHAVTNPVDSADSHRTPLPCETRSYELTGYQATGPAGRYRASDLVSPDPEHPAQFIHLFDTELDAEQQPTGGRQRRLVERTRTLYRADDLSGLLPLGHLESSALPGETYQLAFTPGLLARTYRRGGPPQEELLPAPADVLGGQGADGGGYRRSQDLRTAGLFPAADPDDHWWSPGGQVFLDPVTDSPAAAELAHARRNFYLPHRYRDPFHTTAAPTETVVGYDPYLLLVARTRDALGNVVTVETTDDSGATATRIDYRVLQPTWITDPNGNRTQVAFDALGMVTGTAVMGKAPPAVAEGDSLAGFEADLPDTDTEPDAVVADPAAVLGGATTRVMYDLFAYARTKDHPNPRPATVHTLARETHASEPVPVGGLRIRHELSYSDGFGREIQKKSQAEAGPVPLRGADGAVVVGADGQPVLTAVGVPRWVGSGWTVLNNKGRPVRQYEPFFTDTYRFEFDVRIGVSPVLCYDPVGRVVATLHPDHTWQKVLFGPWRQETWDTDDTVLIPDPGTDPDVGAFFRRLPATDYLPTWHQQRAGSDLGPQALDAARKAAVHAATPTVTHADPLGRAFLTVVHNTFAHRDRTPNDSVTEEFHRTRVEYDLQGRQLALLDEHTEPDGTPEPRVVQRHTYDLLGNRIHQAGMDSGERWTLPDSTGSPIHAWDSRGHHLRTSHDPLRRPVGTHLSEHGGPELLVGRMLYGESLPDPEPRNLRGQVAELRDQAGLATNEEFDFAGRLLRGGRRLVADHSSTVDWSVDVPMAAETYRSRTRFDALGRPVQQVAPHSDQPGTAISVLQPRYNEGGLLEAVDAWLGGDTEPAALLDPAGADLHAVTGVDYDAKGQRTLIAYGNGARTSYTYDPLTFRLVQLVTLRDPVAYPDDCPQPPDADRPGCQVQNLHYTYDAAGNVTHLRDDAQQTVFLRNRRVEPSADYTYDATHRLIEATGREHLGQAGAAPTPASYQDRPRTGILLSAADGNAMGRYLERYVYDAVGNIRQLVHRGSDPANPGWTRTYTYAEPSLLEPDRPGNRLTSTSVGATTETYTTADARYDAHGNMPRMPQLQAMQWDFKDQLRMTRRQAVDAADTDGTQHQGERTYYVYGHDGRRVRKVTELATGAIKDERIYLDGTEIHRRHGRDPLVRETLHLTDGDRRIALVETRTQGTEPGVPPRLVRYQLGNHLGSATLELDHTAQVITYEEYTPYGSTSYQATRSQTETPKRYRFTAKERDEESGLYYHGARYYAPWLTRWTSCDPAHLVDGPNPYRYCRNSPVSSIDRDGRQTCDSAVATCPPLVSSQEAASKTSSEAERVNEENQKFLTAVATGEAKLPTYTAENFMADIDAALKDVSTPEARMARDVAMAESERDAASAAERKEAAEKQALIDKDRPGTAASLVPVVGELGDAAAYFKHGEVAWGTVHLAMAVTDIAPVKSLGRAGLKTAAKVLARETAIEVVGKRGRGWIRAGGLDKLGRSTGAAAYLTPGMVKTGTATASHVKPAGFVGEKAGHVRGHLIGRQMGGSGTDLRNLTTLDKYANSIMRDFEKEVRVALNAGESVKYTVVPVYRGSELIPVAVTMRAQSTGGLDMFLAVLNIPK
ncbi:MULTISPECIES: SpvB/TcaC N-terminal domain-containing protein [unclassified Streptomyces]|uniref:SpvB/TcaC N-terminal domain-containing protein n=1 Tax=unclassified Streptomyces TaxID=2593676 RepID=UPI00131A66C7|nr:MULTISPECIES: SpvB/TcaC N-terminal domain-containing protein [unclassified Streptomyces]